MKRMFLMLVVLFSTTLTAHQEPQISEEILNSCEGSVIGVIADRAYLRPEKLTCIGGEWFLQNDFQQFMPLGTIILQDAVGYYLYAGKMECPRGHTGFKKKNGIWYCFEAECPYFYGKHF
jgi:hypothetical protein